MPSPPSCPLHSLPPLLPQHTPASHLSRGPLTWIMKKRKENNNQALRERKGLEQMFQPGLSVGNWWWQPWGGGGVGWSRITSSLWERQIAWLEKQSNGNLSTHVWDWYNEWIYRHAICHIFCHIQHMYMVYRTQILKNKQNPKNFLGSEKIILASYSIIKLCSAIIE